MKGVIFTEFLEMVEQQFGWEVADDIIEQAALPSGGAYTAVGTYDHRELLQLVTHLSTRLDTPIPALMHAFGTYAFGRFVVGYPHFFDGVDSAFGLLENIEDYIHVEVRKLYPEAELPRFNCERPAPHVLIMEYRSQRPFADFAEGLMRGCIQHFEEDISITREPLDDPQRHVRFTLTRAA